MQSMSHRVAGNNSKSPCSQADVSTNIGPQSEGLLQNSSLHSINFLYISSTYPDEKLGSIFFQKNKTGAINPPTIEKRVKSDKELTGSFKFVQDCKFSTLDGVFRE